MTAKTRAVLKSENVAEFPDNTAGEITAADLRGQLDDIIDSATFPEDGSGGGDDLNTTPVAPAGSTLARPMPDWLAGSPVIECPGDVLVAPEHRGAWLHMMSDLGSIIILPDSWPPGMAFGARQIGLGQVLWQLGGSSTMQLPTTRADHVSIAEQYEEVVFRVISNSDGNHAVWSVVGGTF